MADIRFAPGWPGIDPRWTSSAKSAVGTALGCDSRVWFTTSHGILNEIYYPEVDTACLRDAGFLISAPGFFSEEKRDTESTVAWAAPGVPAFRMRNTCRVGRFEIEKRISASTEFDAVLQQVRFVPHVGTLADYTLTLLLSPHLGNHGGGNTGWLGESKGEHLLFAKRDGLALAVACSRPFSRRTVGFAGERDAWHDVRAHGRITAVYDRAENGNLALAAEIDLTGCGGKFVVAIGFGSDPEAAGLHARAALLHPYEESERRYREDWQRWQSRLRELDEDPSVDRPLYRTSMAVMRTHMAESNDGGAIASLSVPWGASKGDGDLGGYHLVWPRDMVETAIGMLAGGARYEMHEMLHFLAVTQERDGHWPQNMWLNGSAYWTGLQIDETALPILLVDAARREGAIGEHDLTTYWPMVARAARFVAMHGPATDQDRWEESAGYAPFTLAVSIAALLVAAELAEVVGEPELATYLRDTADDWNADIERWTYAAGSPLARSLGVTGYYVRIGSATGGDRESATGGATLVKNRTLEHAMIATDHLVSTDALALVRFGLRAPDDPRIVDTVRVIDAMLRTEMPTGPGWKRYNEDGYGEHEDGRPFDGTGVGRRWPLLAGERAHYELAAGNRDEAERLASVLRAQASPGGMLPEQVWDDADIPELELFNGRASGSAMPLVWAHSEYVKLLRSLHDGQVYDCPPQAAARYVASRNVARVTSWHSGMPPRVVREGTILRIDTPSPVRVRWTADGWAHHDDVDASRVAEGVWTTELPTGELPHGTKVEFTLFWTLERRWEGRNVLLEVDGAGE